MGGHAGGEVASQMAVETLKDFFDNQWQNALPDEKTIRESIFLANQELYNMNQKNASSGTGRMGTTLVMLLVHNTQVAIAHVGDSRLYSLTKQDGLQRLTVDHEVGQREIQRGVEESIAYSRPDAYQLTQALGPRDHNFIKPDITFLEINQDTLLILGSDGLTDNDLLENHGSKYLLPLLSAGNDLDRGANKLIELANKYNGHDNITAVLVRVRAAS
jgi:protein phosphatase